MVDVDNFKNYNDTLGHMKGDEALKIIAAALGGKSRKIDTVARYGGEEFAIVMPGTSKDNARLSLKGCAARSRRYSPTKRTYSRASALR